ncbi:MAG: hypothetical protein IKA64_01955 [Clostridia bacterium]|nr:hypothetical protein [Clostridia bacterium]
METNYLKDWYFERRGDGNVIIMGTIYNDIKRRFADGTSIHTSRVLKADFVNGVVETKNSVYHLELRSENENNI